ncbi:molybdenum ABC transporter ATP-binding protein [Hoeflea sp. YIM 152468]|uniref:molybdenum ABC transporter ATP-binding protein n=1 Tax=Hoeflea sp. YIM 152468 TaxID=3031759 RepID=UPI0023DC0967|nr:molybdenum ABC transporter ATP-binding protein [Hoeflea sp. YIM 152468]MDF1609443.1 molybdenum ABC transporter ATP-binding protein [Hoeflea sp. YIM 152468]
MSFSVRLLHRFGNFVLDVDFTAPAGVTALFGRSGSGKTSVVNAIAGLFKPEAGQISVGGRVLYDSERGASIPVHQRRLGYVFQEGRLFPHLSVQQNLGYGRWFAPGGAATRAEFERVVAMLGIEGLLERRPGSLSGGEKQRVAIGRALLASPQLLLMDEPLAALDEERKAEILPYLERLCEHSEIPIVYVSHSMAEVARLATTLVLMEDGIVTRSGPASEVLSDPESVPALGIRTAGASLRATVAAQEEDGLTRLETTAGPLFLPRVEAPVGALVSIRILAHDVILSRTRPEGLSALNILATTVTAVRLGDGPGAIVQLRAGEDLLLARITRRSAMALELTPGADCFAILKTVSVAQQNVGRTG